VQTELPLLYQLAFTQSLGAACIAFKRCRDLHIMVPTNIFQAVKSRWDRNWLMSEGVLLAACRNVWEEVIVQLY